MAKTLTSRWMLSIFLVFGVLITLFVAPQRDLSALASMVMSSYDDDDG